MPMSINCMYIINKQFMFKLPIVQYYRNNNILKFKLLINSLSFFHLIQYLKIYKY